MYNDAGLTPVQYFAMKKSIELGRILQREHPEIAELFRRGNTLVEIVEELSLESKYGVNQNAASAAVQRAISGYAGNYSGIDFEYEGLIEEDERIRIGKEHKLKSSFENAHILMEEKRGIFGKTLEQRAEEGRRNYHRSLGKLTTEQRRAFGKGAYQKGLAKRTTEQRRADAHKGGIVQGNMPWTDEEKEYVYQLSLDPKYQYSEGPNKGKNDRWKIMSEVNQKFHRGNEVRSLNSVSLMISYLRKNCGDKIYTVPKWTDEERELIRQLSLDPKYQYSEGKLKGKVNRDLVLGEINKIFHGGEEVRTINALSAALCAIRKQNRMKSD